MKTVPASPVEPGNSGDRPATGSPLGQVWRGPGRADLGYCLRLCHDCVATWFGGNGHDTSLVGLHAGDVCVSCGSQPRSAA